MSQEQIDSGWFPVCIELAGGRGPLEIGYVTTLAEHAAVEAAAHARMDELVALDDAVDETPEGEAALDAILALCATITEDALRQARGAVPGPSAGS